MNDKLMIISYSILAIMTFILFIMLMHYVGEVIELNDKVWELYLDDLTRANTVDQARYD